ncbi:2-amino-4-hydroxy-6-hydroxymethyldihydropteridine diphosphokinase [Methylophaga sp.]|uniref:2-amino-4-hydroxy-6- hydroxymethyldihydropteridine diphosphokinase n=1 Tax=Methylophaga sp. TaxID=2024840 RepID=UPI003A9428BB
MQVFIGLGSNLDDPQTQILTAIEDIKNLEDTRLLHQSSLYHSPPMGPQDQPDYVNAVVEVDTALPPHVLLDNLQQLEQKHGRVKKRHWGERTLDLDILVYSDYVIDDDRLKVPHPGLSERAFVVYPLAEIVADLTIPGQGQLSVIKQNCPLDGLRKVETHN